MKQSKLQSIVETVTSTVIGYTVAFASQLIIFPLYDIHISMSANVWIGIWFTVVSLLRGYAVRRWFNHIHYKQEAHNEH